MKKLLFFRSSASSNGTSNPVSTTSAPKQIVCDKPLENGVNSQASDKSVNNLHSPKGFFSKSRKQNSSSGINPSLRRSRSFSSTAFPGIEQGQMNLGDQSRINRQKERSRSPSDRISHRAHHHFEHSSRCQTLTPDREYGPRQFEETSVQNAHGFDRPGPASSFITHDSSGNSSTSSSNTSSKVVDRYIDGEELTEINRTRNSTLKNHHGNTSLRLPPKSTAPNSPSYIGAKDKPRAQSFREKEAKSTRLRLSMDWAENGYGHESPRSLAKNVIERLSQSHAMPKTSSKEFTPENLITIEDICGISSNECCEYGTVDVGCKSYSLEEPHKLLNGYQGMDHSRIQKQNGFWGHSCDGPTHDITEEGIDAELRRRSKEAEERVMLLSEELEQESFLHNGGFTVPDLVQVIRNLVMDRIGLAREVSVLIQSQISERVSGKEELRCTKAELESQIWRLEKEKNELQLSLEKELDRRSTDLSLKLEKYQLEEQRLRERVRELAEQNVSLQREVYSISEKETENRNVITYSEKQLKELTVKIEEMTEENQNLQLSLSEVQEKYKTAERNYNFIQRNFEEKQKECKGLHKSMTRLLRTCNEQEKTINGLREGFCQEFQTNQSVKKNDRIEKLQMEQVRLAGVELALRRELESYRAEVDSLRHENISLLNRLKSDGKECLAATFKLEKEMRTRICYLQNQCLMMLNESTHLCSKSLDFIKGKAGQIHQDTQQGLEATENGLDEQFIIETDVKVQGLKHGTESLTRSLQTMSALLQEKSCLMASKSHPQGLDPDILVKLNEQTSEATIKEELKAEILLTSLLREKLYSKEMEVEQLQAELATAVRGNDILRYEVQKVLDNVSSMTHKLKDLELQMLKKEEHLNHLQSELQESKMELALVRGILPKVSEERDLMWKEVKQYSENNMLLNSEIGALKKKIEALDEDILLKEGQITILKDSLSKKPFDLLSSADPTHESLLD